MNKTAYAYFSQVYRHEELFNANLAALDELRDKALRVTRTFSSTPVQSSERRPMADSLDSLHDLEADILADNERIMKTVREVRAVIRSLEDPDQRLVLEKRFLRSQSISQIAMDLGYSVSKVKKIYSDALDAAALPSFDRN